MNISEFLQVQAKAQAKGSSILPEAAVERLREVGSNYAAQLIAPRFAVGDFVTPMSDAPITGAGYPHFVVETRAAEPNFKSGEPGAYRFGLRQDMRVLALKGDTIAAWWVESFWFEPYALPAQPATVDAA